MPLREDIIDHNRSPHREIFDPFLGIIHIYIYIYFSIYNIYRIKSIIYIYIFIVSYILLYYIIILLHIYRSESITNS